MYEKEDEWVRTVRRCVCHRTANVATQASLTHPHIYIVYDCILSYVEQQAKEGFELFDAILDGMEQEEKELLEYERDTTEHSVVSSLKAPAASMTLEERLEALRLRSASSSQSAKVSAFAAQIPEAAPLSASTPSVLPRESSSVRAKSQPTPFRREQAKVGTQFNYEVWKLRLNHFTLMLSPKLATGEQRQLPVSRQAVVDHRGERGFE